MRSHEREGAGKCACCSFPANFEIWEHLVCIPCATAWNVAAPTYGEVKAKYGPDPDLDSVYTAFTKRWVEKRKQEAR